jgi:hypothetical protein
MSDDSVADELLAGVGRGDEELIDPREGDYDASLTDARLVENSPSAQVKHAVVLTFSGMEDSEGRDFSVDDRVNVPTSDSSDDVKRMFQASLHTFGIVSRSDRRPYFADSDEQRAAILGAYKALIGTRFPLRLYTKDGWLRVRVRRS